jgi:hypothetical protein
LSKEEDPNLHVWHFNLSSATFAPTPLNRQPRAQRNRQKNRRQPQRSPDDESERARLTQSQSSA